MSGAAACTSGAIARIGPVSAAPACTSGAIARIRPVSAAPSPHIRRDCAVSTGIGHPEPAHPARLRGLDRSRPLHPAHPARLRGLDRSRPPHPHIQRNRADQTPTASPHPPPPKDATHRDTPGVTGCRPVAELHFFTGTMDSGKSTLALQTNHNHAARGRVGRIFTTHDRAGEATGVVRLGLTHDAHRGRRGLRLLALRRRLADPAAARIDYLICDEAQFYTRRAGRPAGQDRRRAADRRVLLRHPHRLPHRAVPGLRAAGRARRPDEVLQVEALCWCGKRATHNARTEDGVMVTEGEVIVVGDVEEQRRTPGRGRLRGALPPAPPPPADRRPRPGGQPGRRSRCRSADRPSGHDHRDQHLVRASASRAGRPGWSRRGSRRST